MCKTGFESSDESDEDAWRFRCGPGLECVQAHVQREAEKHVKENSRKRLNVLTREG